MKLDRRVVALGAVAALTLGTPSAAFAAGHGSSSKAKGGHSAQAGKAKEAAKKKKDEKARVTFPGTVVSADAASITVSRKERGVVVQRTFVVDARTEVKKDGVRGTTALAQPGDHAVVHARRVDGRLVAHKVNVSAPTAAVTPPDTPTATIVI
jgi:hypothetical protein